MLTSWDASGCLTLIALGSLPFARGSTPTAPGHAPCVSQCAEDASRATTVTVSGGSIVVAHLLVGAAAAPGDLRKAAVTASALDDALTGAAEGLKAARSAWKQAEVALDKAWKSMAESLEGAGEADSAPEEVFRDALLYGIPNQGLHDW